MPAPTVHVMAELAQGVVDALNAQTMTMDFDAARGWAPIITAADADDPTVTVVPRSDAMPFSARGHKQHRLQIDVVVQRQHGDSSSGGHAPVERCDEIAALVQDVVDYLGNPANKIVTTNLSATPIEIANEADVDAFDDGIFRMVVSVTYSFFR